MLLNPKILLSYLTYYYSALALPVIILVMCLSINGERAENYTTVKRLILNSNTLATKRKIRVLNYVYGKGVSIP